MRRFRFLVCPTKRGLIKKLAKQSIDQSYCRLILGGSLGEDYTVIKSDGRVLLVYLRQPGNVRDILLEIAPVLSQARFKSVGRQARTRTVGFMDKSRKKHYGRKTAYTRDNPDWKAMLPLFQALDSIYAQTLPREYELQSAFAKLTPDWIIPGTCSTTGSINYEQVFKCHRDKNNLANGIGAMTVYRTEPHDFDGFLTVFPQWKVAVDMQCGDVLLFDGGDWHGNTPYTPHVANGSIKRISVVLYYRKGFLQCGGAKEEMEKAQKLV